MRKDREGGAQKNAKRELLHKQCVSSACQLYDQCPCQFTTTTKLEP